MTTAAKRATVYLDPVLHKALKLKAVETSRSVSDLVNDAIREALAEDAEDITAFEERWPDIRSISKNPLRRISARYRRKIFRRSSVV